MTTGQYRTMSAAVAHANACLDYHQGYRFGKEHGLLSADSDDCGQQSD